MGKKELLQGSVDKTRFQVLSEPAPTHIHDISYFLNNRYNNNSIYFVSGSALICTYVHLILITTL